MFESNTPYRKVSPRIRSLSTIAYISTSQTPSWTPALVEDSVYDDKAEKGTVV